MSFYNTCSLRLEQKERKNGKLLDRGRLTK